MGRLLAAAAAGGSLLKSLARAAPVLLRDPPDEGIAWVCPMHPAYTAAAAGTCPICGMQLIQTRPYDARDYQLAFRTEPANVRPGEKVTLFFTFLRPGTAEVVKDFEIVHTKPFHLFVISQDMEFFEHIHPTMRPDGTWTIDTTVPKPGYYEVLCDVMPSGGSGQFLSAPFVTADYNGDLATDSAHLDPDKVLKKSAADITVTATFDPPQPTACQYVHLNFYLTDTATGRPITDLQTYLGAFGHMLLMSEDLRCYVHSHPNNFVIQSEDSANAPEYIIPPDADLDAIRGGPKVMFDALMPKPGVFRAWAQFQRNNQVRTIALTFTVAPGPAEPVLS
ncbi:MAG TPA: heavy metal-binding domain-containing protein [Steroidobacteraceae bacterium]